MGHYPLAFIGFIASKALELKTEGTLASSVVVKRFFDKKCFPANKKLFDGFALKRLNGFPIERGKSLEGRYKSNFSNAGFTFF